MRRTELLQEVRKMTCGGWQERRLTQEEAARLLGGVSARPAPAKAGEWLPKEPAAQGIDTMQSANRSLVEHYRTAFNEECAVPATEPGTAFVPFIGPGLADIVCEHHERTVNRDNCVSFEGKRLQISAQVHRCHFIKAPRSIAPPTGVWRCSTGRASSPNTSPMAPSSQSSPLCRCVSGPEALVERVPLCGALDMGLAHINVSGAGAWAWRTRAAPTRSRCRPPLARGQALRRGSLRSPRLRLAGTGNPDG